MTYKNDPRRITAKFTSICSKCSCTIKKGTQIYYWPSDRKAYCLNCGEVPYLQFRSAAADEDVYAGTGNPYCG
ncbi:MAG: hypothetical protein JZU47_10070 [Prolixibacteraceae bacterium]|nr:hypothetical protein [Prolixibacteraceae bacterium]